jgi:hypothetical protein
VKHQSPGRRAAAYWFADGLPDIVLGLTFLIFGAGGFWWRIYAPHPWVYDVWLVGAGVMLFVWKERAILDFLKSRVTYPRTGYVRPPERSEASVNLIGLSLNSAPADDNVTSFDRRTVMAIFWVFYCLVGPIPSTRWFAPLMMLALAVLLYALNRNSERPFQWWSVLILALTGVVFLLVDVPLLLRGLVSVLLAGGWLVARGGWTLFHYLRANPSPRAPEGVRA